MINPGRATSSFGTPWGAIGQLCSQKDHWNTITTDIPALLVTSPHGSNFGIKQKVSKTYA